MTTTTIDQTTACPAWCQGPAWHGSDDGFEFAHAGPSWHLTVRGGTTTPDGLTTGDYQSVSVYLGQQDSPGAEPTISLSCRDDEGNSSWLVLTPAQAMRIAAMLNAAVVPVITGNGLVSVITEDGVRVKRLAPV